jgi:flagellar hook protein FlgE
MLRSMNSAISGLRMHQLFMDVIGNNIANVNTTAFKSGRMTFQTMLSQTIRSSVAATEARGGINAVQVGLGTSVASVEMLQAQGGFTTTNKVTDLGIQGDGFFILSDGFQNFYTRDGSFDLDENGMLISPYTGLKVAGWMGIDGVIETNRPPAPGIIINLGPTVEARASTEVQLNGNLNGAPTHILKTGVAEGPTETGNGAQAVASFSVSQGALGDTITFTYDGVTYTTPIADNLVTPTNGGLPQRPPGTLMSTIANDIQVAMYTALVSAGNAPAGLAVGNMPIQIAVVDDGGLTGGEAFFTFTAPKALKFGGSPSSNSDIGNVLRNRASEGLQLVNATIRVYDSLGNTQDITVKFEKVTEIEDPIDPANAVMVPVENTWRWSAVGGQVDVNGFDTTNQPLGGGWGYVRFDGTGNFLGVESRSVVAPIPLPPSATTRIDQPSKAIVRFDWNNGAQNGQNITLDFSQITQLQNGNTVAEYKNDGFATGTLISFVIGTDGTITGQFSNGKGLDLARIALATFPNVSGLTSIGSNLFLESANSGNALIGEALTGTRGSMNAGQLEMSNVDLADQFTSMIRAQRGFQANSRIITTSDEMLQDLVNLKR